MKNKTAILTFILFYAIPLFAQKVKYESSFENAKSVALKEHKPIAILISMKQTTTTPLYIKALQEDSVALKFNNSFINYKIDLSDTSVSRKIMEDYKVFRVPSFIFLDSKGGLMFSEVAFVVKSKQLLELADRALAASTNKSLVDYDIEFNKGKKDMLFIKEYITRRENAGLFDNADLIEQYVSGLTISDLNKYSEVLFILKAGPYADSNAYKLAFTNRLIVDSIFKTEPLEDRVAMNNATINNTMSSAISNKNIKRAYAAATFTRKSWSKDYNEGQKRYQQKMLLFYDATNDTLNYLQLANMFYDQHYMHISKDSIQKKDSLNYLSARNKAREIAKKNVIDTSKNLTYAFSYSKNSYATELNNAAWKFYQIAGDNDNYLLKAMLWSRRSIELDPKAAYYDTYAHLLYKLKIYDEAQSIQKTAIELCNTEKIDNKLYKIELEKMVTKTL